jgi:hypothetical protein
MNKAEAEKRALLIISEAKPCPFCGQIPVFRFTCDSAHSSSGSWGHFAVRNPCCAPTGTGQTKLFFCNNFDPPDYKLWLQMLDSLVDQWNNRKATPTPSGEND